MMTVFAADIGLYFGSLLVLWAIPGPVWVVILARSLAHGFRGAWPVALAVALGDILWPLCAIFGLSWILSIYGGFLEAMRWIAALVFIVMGAMLLPQRVSAMGVSQTTSSPSFWAAFSVGIAAIIGNPKAILFYMGVLPGFFDIRHINAVDIALISITSGTVSFVGNLSLALFIGRARRFIASPKALRRTNVISGVLLILVGVIIPFTK